MATLPRAGAGNTERTTDENHHRNLNASSGCDRGKLRRSRQLSAFSNADRGRIEGSVMKRFTETNKWRDPWFRKLTSPAKQLWEYLRDNCDAIGLIDVDFTLVSADCGQKITQSHMAELGDRVQQVSESKFFLTKFITFQYGELKASCPPHRTIIKLVESHGLVKSAFNYSYPNARVVTTLQDKTRQDRNGKGQEEGLLGEKAITPEQIYDCYPRKVGRPEALKAILKAMGKIDATKLMEKTKLYAASRVGEDPNFTPHPATWFNQERYNDDPATWKRSSQVTQPNRRDAGVAPAPTTYTATKPRAQREREAREAREAAALDQSLVADGSPPSPTESSSQPAL